jgi:intracellular sulfur oxidation DsrE/DsrF family protein
MKPHVENSRRKFIGTLAASAGMAGIASPLLATSLPTSPVSSTKINESEAWIEKIKGSHRIVYDAPEPHDGFPFIWTWAFHLTNNQTGTSDEDMTAMVVLRHNAIPFAMKDAVWSKYKLGEAFHITDNTTGKPAIRNPFYIPKEGDYPIPGIDGIKRLQERGAMFCVCELAINVMSGFISNSMGLDHEDVKKDWHNNILPDIQLVPSGVWALGRAQEKNCGYIYAGG